MRLIKIKSSDFDSSISGILFFPILSTLKFNLRFCGNTEANENSDEENSVNLFMKIFRSTERKEFIRKHSLPESGSPLPPHNGGGDLKIWNLSRTRDSHRFGGVSSGGVPPDPISNSEVKPACGDPSAEVARC